MNSPLKVIIAASLLAVLLFACSRSYTFMAFSYPPESKPHGNNWEYIGKIIAWDPLWKNSTIKGKRKIEILIQDKNKKNLLHDTFKVNSASLERKILWEKFEKLTIELFEKGNPYFSEDEYNKKLLREGPRHLITLSYAWNGSQFIRN